MSMIQCGRPVAAPPAGYRPLAVGETIPRISDYYIWFGGRGPWGRNPNDAASIYAGRKFDPVFLAWIAVPGNYVRDFTTEDEGGVV